MRFEKPKEVTNIMAGLVFLLLVGDSKFNSSLEGNHARRTVTAEPHAQQSGGRRDRAGHSAKAGLGCWIARSTRLIAGQGKVGMVEEIEELRIEAKA